ncbi:MAG: hypothetical protein IPK06_16405 [Ignavibacteriae bacterium]|nr:hypothetical protein [Ignavibacteriota bacterium]
MKFVKQNQVYIVLIVALFLNSCFDKPNEFVSPTWDVDLNIPITKKEFSLLEIVEKDSSFLKSSEDPQSMGLIYFGDEKPISTVKIDNQLSINGFQINNSQQLGSIKINIPIPTATNIKVEEWAEDVTSGSTQIFPEQEGNVTLDVEGIKTVEKIYVEDGVLKLIIFNNLPVDIELRGIIIRNKIDQSIVAEQINTIDNWVKVPKYQIDSLKFPLINSEISNQLEYVGTIYSKGSDGIEVVIPEESGTTILALFDDLTISGATAPLPVQNITAEKAIVLDDSTYIETAEISDGRGNIIFNNNLDVHLNVKITFENILDASKNKYSIFVPLEKNQKQKVVNINDLSGWFISSTSPGELTNKLNYKFEIVTDSTGEISTVEKNDSISFNIDFDDIILKSITGKLKPTPFNITESEFNLDYGSFDSNLDFQSAKFKNSKILLNLGSSSNLKFKINGVITSTNGQTTKSIILDNIILPSDNGGEVDISELLNDYSKDLPYNFKLIGSGIINPDYEVGTVSSQDSIFGNMKFEIPLNVGIGEATFIDTIDLNLGDIKDDDIDNINYGEVTVNIENSVPVNLRFNAMVLDSNNNEIMPLPTENNPTSYLEVQSPTVSSEGDVLNTVKSEHTLKLYNDEIIELIKHPFLKIMFAFETPNSDEQNVKFRTSNKINISIKVKASYRADFSGE